MTATQFIVKRFVTVIILLSICEARSPHPSVHLSGERNNVKNQSVVPIPVFERNNLNGYLNSTLNTVKRVINALPRPKQMLHYGKQVLIGVPEEVASNTKRFLCEFQSAFLSFKFK